MADLKREIVAAATAALGLAGCASEPARVRSDSIVQQDQEQAVGREAAPPSPPATTAVQPTLTAPTPVPAEAAVEAAPEREDTPMMRRPRPVAAPPGVRARREGQREPGAACGAACGAGCSAEPLDDDE